MNTAPSAPEAGPPVDDESSRLRNRIRELEEELAAVRAGERQRANAAGVMGSLASFPDEITPAAVVEPGRPANRPTAWFPQHAALTESERAVQRRLAEIEALYGCARAGMALIDENFRFVHVNRWLAEMNGISEAECLGKPVADVVPEIWPSIEPFFRAVAQERRPVRNLEVRGTTRAQPGIDRIWIADYDPVFDAAGAFLGVSAFVTEVTEERRAQRAAEQSFRELQERAAEIEAIYASAPVGLCVFDDQLRFRRVNQTLAEINHLPAEDHIGKTVAEVVPDFAEASAAALHQLMESGKPLLDFEMSGRSGIDPEIRYWNNRWVPLRDESGKIIGVSVAVEEITDRRRADKKLRDSEQLYRAIGESIDYGVWVCNPEGRNTYLSDSMLTLIGRTREEWSHGGWADALHPEDREKIVARWMECVRSGSQLDAEYRVLGADGEYHYILARGVPVRNPDGSVVCWAGINLDIGELKRTEQSLRESEIRERLRAAELQAVMDAVPVVINISRDREGRRIVSNTMGYRLLRVPSGENVSKSAPEAERPKHFRPMRNGVEIPPEDLPMQYAGRTGQEVHDCEFDLVFDTGEVRHWIGNAVPLLDASGDPSGAVAAFVDVTERRQAEEHQRHAQKLEGLGLLAGGIAHDFNNLLVGIIGNGSLAQEILPAGHPAAELISDVVSAGEKAAHLTRQMLAYAGKGQFVLKPVDLSRAVAEMQSLVRPAIPPKVLTRFELPDGLPCIEADCGQVQQVFMNLVINAAEAIGPEGGIISIRTGTREVEDARRAATALGELKPGEYVFLEVVDSGSGMDDATRSRIFEPFFTTKFTGRGLGLAAAAGVVVAHKGAIEVASTPGAGTRFTILFPAEHAAMPPDPSAADSGVARGHGKVLVVDDEAIVREVTRQALERQGFEVLLAGSGAEAIELFRTHSDALVLTILDLTMPGLTGQETLPHLLAIRDDVPIVISSGYSERETMRQFAGQTVAAFLQKPYTAKELAQLVAKILRGKTMAGKAPSD